MKYVVTLFLVFVCGVTYSQECGFNNRVYHDVSRVSLDFNSVTWEDVNVPIVVHVFHSGESVGVYPNLSDTKIYDMVEFLNVSFSGGLNDDMYDSKIKFCLSSNYEIQRYSIDDLYWVDSWDLGDMSFDSYDFYFNCLDNISIDYENNLNIFIAPYVSPQLGLGGWYEDNYGGVLLNSELLYEDVIDHTTIPHEVAHYLGLSHTFNEYNNCGEASLEIDCDTQGDGICDTPPTWLYVCNDNPCYDSNSYEANILSVNFMGINTICRSSFTNGQIDKMQYNLQNTSRINLGLNQCSCNSIENYECLCSDECHYDLDNNNIVDLGDLLEFLVIVFNDGDCQNGDFDGSGYIDTLDLLDLLSVMGYECE